jgi:hypothetical protein
MVAAHGPSTPAVPEDGIVDPRVVLPVLTPK